MYVPKGKKELEMFKNERKEGYEKSGEGKKGKDNYKEYKQNIRKI